MTVDRLSIDLEEGNEMNQDTVKLLETFRDMETTAIIADELEKIIKEVGNIDGTKEFVAAVLLAAMRSGKGSITMESLN